MDRRVFGDVDEMLDAAALTTIVGSNVSEVERVRIETEGFSDNVIERVTCTEPSGDKIQLVVKHFERRDWVAALTSDSRVREISLLEAGLYRDLPHECQAPMLAATRGESGDSLLMWDVSSSLFPPGDDPIAEDQLVTCVRGVAALHARYWGGGQLPSAPVDFCSTQAWLGLLTPEQVSALYEEGKRVRSLIEQRTFPFDRDWPKWEPDPDWPMPELPSDWSVVRPDVDA